ncbi:MAG: DedA family protein [Puniceicoccales bacterium]|jgi:membrane-associated protein|nr:DedA family protein [Puniceicoccales bacterium]
MEELFKQLVDFVLHVDVHLAGFTTKYGLWTYALLFLIIFAETGFVVTPFLPGDSLLFAAGALCAMPETGLNAAVLIVLLWTAAVLGDSVNYWIGARAGPKVFTREDSIFLRKKHLERAHAFFEKFGGRAILLARFAPIIRTFVPFVAGIGKMRYTRFAFYNVTGGFLWIMFFVVGGYLFGNLPIVKRYFHLVIVGIVVVSLIPVVVEFIRARQALRGGVGTSPSDVR